MPAQAAHRIVAAEGDRLRRECGANIVSLGRDYRVPRFSLGPAVARSIREDMGVIPGVFGGRWVTGEGLLVMVPPGPEKDAVMSWSPGLIRSAAPEGRVDLRLGHPLVDDFLAFADARCRPNTVLAAGSI
ncbi:MAG: hypothetical protein ACJAXA_002608 [Candidatus Aldehydirespiratoraceae bacterium]|jgi:hypothetical protein